MKFPNPYSGLKGLPSDVWVIAATTLINRAGMMALPFLVLYLTEQLHASPSLAGLALSAYGIGGLVTAPIAGRLADRIGPFAVLRGSLALTGIVLFIIPLVPSFWGVLFLTFLWAVVAEAARPATMSALTGSATPELRKAAIALNRLAVNLGMGIGPAIGGFLALVSFPLLFVVDALSSLTAAATLSLLVYRQRKAGKPSSFESPATDPRQRETHHDRSVVWQDRRAVGFFVVAMLLNLIYAQSNGAMPLYLVHHLGFKESFFGAMFIVNTMTIVAIEVPLNVSMARWPAWKANAVSAVLIGVGFGAMGLATTAIPIALSVVVWTFGEMIFFPTATAYMAELAPAGRTGEYMGALSATFSLSMIVGPWAGTALLEKFGPQVTWSVMLVFGLLAAGLLAVTHPRNPEASEAL